MILSVLMGQEFDHLQGLRVTGYRALNHIAKNRCDGIIKDETCMMNIVGVNGIVRHICVVWVNFR